MATLSFKMRVLLFLYSTQNLVGSGLAMLGLGLFFLGVIDDWWFPIVVGLYAIGWLIIPTDKNLESQILHQATQENLTGSIEDLLKTGGSRLPREAVDRLLAIHETVETLSPKLFSGGIAMNYAISLNNAITRDLPETVRNYLNLPTVFSSIHVLKDGKTCKQLLIEQLDFLNSELRKIAENVYKDDAEALVVNGKFLEEKFHSLKFVN